MGEAARRRIDGREDSEPDSTGGVVPVDWFVDPVDQARGASGVTTLDDLASAFLAAHPEVAGDVLL
ncbi:transcriptional regulator, partial [Kocuria tytonicola]